MYKFILYKDDFEWADPQYMVISLSRNSDLKLIDGTKEVITKLGYKLHSDTYIISDAPDITLMNNARIERSKTLTKLFNNGELKLPSLETLGKSSCWVCAVVMAQLEIIHICIPIHIYHAWKSLENNDMSDGIVLVRMARNDELNKEFLPFDPQRAFTQIGNLLEGTIYV